MTRRLGDAWIGWLTRQTTIDVRANWRLTETSSSPGSVDVALEVAVVPVDQKSDAAQRKWIVGWQGGKAAQVSLPQSPKALNCKACEQAFRGKKWLQMAASNLHEMAY